MTLLQKQSYNLWFNWIADKTMEWAKSKPANKDLKNYIKGLNEIGQYVNQLNIENKVLEKRVSAVRDSKNQTILDLNKQIEELQNKLKQYEI
jgi:predicted RNase H-like nuclease (RuvC/YqgF family)